jgi:hypothetical protein
MSRNITRPSKPSLDDMGISILDDGMYDVTGIERVFLDNSNKDEIDPSDMELAEKFLTEHGSSNVVAGAPYETYGVFLFASKPSNFNQENTMGYAGRGVNCLIANAPRELLILAEND